ncbi:MAG: RNA methyltransferase [Rikenellaceae bacterium]
MTKLNIDNPGIASQIEYLREFISVERYEKLLSRVELRTRGMVLCLEDTYHAHNASATIRSAEAFGLQQIHVVESTCHFRPSQNIVRGTDRWIDIERWDSTQDLVTRLREQGYRIVVTTPRDGATTPDEFDVTSAPFAVFMGTEKTGISEWLMGEADQALYIPMSGFAESLNVSVSAAILTQSLTHRLRQESPQSWQLEKSEREELLLKWVKHSVKDVENILKRGGF